MGNKTSKKKPASTYLDSTPVSSVLQKATEAVEEGNSAQSNKEYREAYIAYRFASALLDLCIRHDSISDKKKSSLIDFNYTLQYKLQDVMALQGIELQRNQSVLRSQKKQVTLSKENLKFPSHVLEEINRNKESISLSEEAMAYKKIRDTIEVCIPNLPMSEVIGQKDAIAMLQDRVVDQHLRPDLFDDAHCRGALLYGPPGNGKTTIAKALATLVAQASSGKMPFFKVTPANFMSKWTGQAEITLTAIFKLAQMNGPAIIFIDEVEALFESRTGTDGQDNTGKGTVQNFLDLMSTYQDVFFIAATNFPWLIDEALHRRLCPTYIRMPVRQDRLDLLKRLFAKVDHFILKKDFDIIADRTEGFSFDDIYNLKEEVIKTMRNITSESKFFKLTTPQEGYEKSWTPCMEYEEGATSKTYRSILDSKDGLAFPTVTMAVVEHCLSVKTPTVSKDTIEKCDLFFEKGKSAVDKMIEAKAKLHKQKLY